MGGPRRRLGIAQGLPPWGGGTSALLQAEVVGRGSEGPWRQRRGQRGERAPLGSRDSGRAALPASGLSP